MIKVNEVCYKPKREEFPAGEQETFTVEIMVNPLKIMAVVPVKTKDGKANCKLMMDYGGREWTIFVTETYDQFSEALDAYIVAGE